MSEWISVKDSLPDDGIYIVNSSWGVRVASYCSWGKPCFQDIITSTDEDRCNFWGDDEKNPFTVTHYTPLPKPPQD